MQRTRKLLARLARLTLLLAALWLLSSLAAAYLLTRRPHAPFPEDVPAVAWGTLQSFRLRTSDGEELGAWFEPGRPERPVVLLLHGNGGQRRNLLPQAEFLAAEGYGVLLVSLRCHGESTGTVNDFGRSTRHDVVAAVRWLEEHQPGRARLVLGQSLGSAAAIFAAPELAGRVQGYVLECPYRDLYSAVRNRTNRYLSPAVGPVAYAGLVTVAPWVLDDVDGISPLRAIAAMPPGVPVLILAGGADRHATPDEARALQRRIEAQAELVVMEGADHVKLRASDPGRYRRLVLDFFARSTAEASGKETPEGE